MTNLLIRAINLTAAIKASNLSDDSLEKAVGLVDQIYLEIKQGFAPNIYDEDDSGLTRSEKELIVANEYILALRKLRERTNIGLKEAKDIGDRWKEKCMKRVSNDIHNNQYHHWVLK